MGKHNAAFGPIVSERWNAPGNISTATLDVSFCGNTVYQEHFHAT